MASARWVDLLAQAIFHTIVAALVVEALVRLWRAREPDQRLALRLVALAYPLAVFPAWAFLFPVREGEWFRESRALFAGRHWQEVRIGGVPLYHVWVATFAALGVALFLMDLVPLLRGRRGAPRATPGPAPEVEARLAELARAMGMAPPPVAFLERGPPALFCAGVRRPTVVVSRAALDLLDAHELRAALAHELAHLERSDPAASWVLMGARALMAPNPAFQVVARAMARDAERRADERAAAAGGDRLALASGLLKLFRATEGRPPARGRRNLPFAGALAGPLARARALDIESRCRRLLEPAPAPLRFPVLRVAAAVASLSALLFFVV